MNFLDNAMDQIISKCCYSPADTKYGPDANEAIIYLCCGAVKVIFTKDFTEEEAGTYDYETTFPHYNVIAIENYTEED